MQWRDQLTRDQQNYIDRNHGTEHFQQIVGGAFWAASLRLVKMRIRQEDHRLVDAAWYTQTRPGTPGHEIKEHVSSGISSLFEDLDDRFGAPTQTGLAWCDEKARELGRHIESYFVRR